jgi:cystathionine beta-lyase/cystathionine gamma-synthase
MSARVHQQSSTAMQLAEVLERHPAVAWVAYPGLESFAQRELAKRQMTTGGTLVTLELAGGAAAAASFISSCTLAQLALSLGGPETLLTHPATITAHLTPAERAAIGVTDGMVRVSVGLEHADDLVSDFVSALDQLG